MSTLMGTNRRRNIGPLLLRNVLWLLAGVHLCTNAANSQSQFKPPRTEFGQPDLQGIWNFASVVPLERPNRFAEREFLTQEDQATLMSDQQRFLELFVSGPFGMDKFWLETDVVPNPRSSLIIYPTNGRIPRLVPGVKRVSGFIAAVYDIQGTRPVRLVIGGIGKTGPEDRGLAERCLLAGGPPPIMPFPLTSYLQIAQSKDHVIVSFESNHEVRTISLDGRPFLDERLQSWLGDSHGHWEGSTLVVVTKNFNGLTESFAGAGDSSAKVVTERFRRTSLDTIQYEATIDDPKTFEDKIALTFPMKKSAVQLYEDACHEGNYSLPAILAGARKQEQTLQRTEVGQSTH
jgi:hypothetical protein